MKKILILFFCFLSGCINAQFGFIDSLSGSYYSNLIVHDDTLVLTGLKFPDFDGLNGILFSKYDTLGNPLLSRVIQDKDNDRYLLSNTRSRNLIRLTDGSGYLFVAARRSDSALLFMRFDNNGDVLWEQGHYDSTSTVIIISSIIEVEDGFLAGGRMQLKSDLSREPIIIKISKEGTVLWQKTYGVAQYDESGQGVIQVSKNKFAFFGNRSLPGTFRDPPGGFTIIIDSLGNKFKEFYTPFNMLDCCVEDLYIDSQGRYVHISRKMELQGGGLKKMQPIFIIRDSSFSVLHKHEYADTLGISHFEKITPVQGNGWVAVGGLNAPTTGMYWNRYAWLMRLDENGEEIWSTQTSLFPDSLATRFITQDLNQVVELSSGSIVASGNFEWRSGSRDERGFLLKVDKNGCWDTIPCRPITSNIEIATRKGEVQIYPNPTSDAFGIYFSDVQSVDIQLFNAAGQIVLNQSDTSSGEQMEVGHLPKGLYFYRLSNKGKVVDVGKLIRN